MSSKVQEWMPNNDNLNIFYDDINNFIEKNLKHTITEDIEELVKSKTISDPIIGYIHFTPIEMYLIDTPLFQRLRNIKQLGLANLVFPSVAYSRFEHSLGVLGRVNQLLNKIIENNTKKMPDDIINKTIDEYKFSIRLAALFHDVGHCLFSHCSERVINNLEQSITIREEFTQHFKKRSQIPFAEIFTISILGNKEFHKYIATSDLTSLSKGKLTKALRDTVHFILGLPSPDNPSTVFLGQLISSGLDADKIDYMTREQHYSGIKLQIDLERILSKLQVFEIDSYQLPTHLNYLKEWFDSNQKLKVLGFAKGGQFVFEEFCIARLALHVKIYLHQKIRLAESQLSQYLSNLADLDFLQNPVNWLYLNEEIIKYPKSVLNEISYEKDLFNSGTIENDIIQKLLKIHHRELYFRTFAFGIMNSRNNTISNSNANYFDKYLKDNIDIDLDMKFKQKIADEANKIKNILLTNNKEILADDFIIELPRLINIQQGQDSLYFERVSLSPVKWTIPIDKIMNYFQENRALGYVFSELDIAPILCLACEKIFFEEYYEVYEQDSFISKNVHKQYKQYKQELTKNNYYSKYPQLKTLSDYLYTAAAVEKIETIYKNLNHFKSYKQRSITINMITTFVNQFPLDLQDVTLSFLLHLKVYDENLLGKKLHEVLPKEDTSNIGLTYLGNKTDSASRYGYELRDLQYDIEDLNEHLILNSDSLYIFDDNINSGKQLINILAEFLDKKDTLPDKYQLSNEFHVQPLSDDKAKEKLKSMDLHFIFIVGYENIESEIKEILQKTLGFYADKIHIHIQNIFKINEKIFTGENSKFQHEHKNELKEYLKKIAKQILINEGKNESNIDRYTLGYAKAEAMVVFPYNVPTMTITALWCDGKLDNDIPWIPLVERRRRTKAGELIGEDEN